MRSVKLSLANKIFEDFQGPYKLCRSEAVSPRLENTYVFPQPYKLNGQIKKNLKVSYTASSGKTAKSCQS